MKKLYNSPVVEATLVNATTFLCVSPFVDNTKTGGMSGEAPRRGGSLGPSY